MSLVNTLVQDFRADVPEFDKNEFRAMSAGMLNTFQSHTNSGTSWVTADLAAKAMATNANNAVKIPVINYKDVTIRTTRPLTIQADENTSALYTVTWTTFAYGFKMYRAVHFNNDISYQRDFNAKMKAMIVKMLSAIEGAAVSAVESAKTRVIASVVGGHTFSSNIVHEYAATLKDSQILGDLKPMMESNNYYDLRMDVVGNQGLNSIVRRMDGFNLQNSENKQWQLGDIDLAFTNAIANGSGKKATGFAINQGCLGLLHRVEADSQYRTKLRTGHEWDTVMVPGLGIEFGSYYYEEAVDASGLDTHTTALTRTGAEVFDFAVDLAFLTPYNSAPTTNASEIIKFDFNTTGGT